MFEVIDEIELLEIDGGKVNGKQVLTGVGGYVAAATVLTIGVAVVSAPVSVPVAAAAGILSGIGSVALTAVSTVVTVTGLIGKDI